MPLTDIAKLNTFLGETDITSAKIQAIKWATGIIEDYCDREFEQKARSEWLKSNKNGRLMTRAYPITPGSNAIVRESEQAVSLTFSGSYGSVVSQRDLRYGQDTLTLEADGTVTNLLLSSYANLAALIAAINAVSGWTASATGSYSYTHIAPISTPIEGGNTVHLYAPGALVFDYEVNQESGIVYLPSNTSDYIYMSYTAGLETMPATLEMIATQMAAAALRLKAENPGMKSESFGDYSYTKADADDLVSPYKISLREWRRL